MLRKSIYTSAVLSDVFSGSKRPRYWHDGFGKILPSSSVFSKNSPLSIIETKLHEK